MRRKIVVARMSAPSTPWPRPAYDDSESSSPQTSDDIDSAMFQGLQHDYEHDPLSAIWEEDPQETTENQRLHDEEPNSQADAQQDLDDNAQSAEHFQDPSPSSLSDTGSDDLIVHRAQDTSGVPESGEAALVPRQFPNSGIALGGGLEDIEDGNKGNIAEKRQQSQAWEDIQDIDWAKQPSRKRKRQCFGKPSRNKKWEPTWHPKFLTTRAAYEDWVATGRSGHNFAPPKMFVKEEMMWKHRIIDENDEQFLFAWAPSPAAPVRR